MEMSQWLSSGKIIDSGYDYVTLDKDVELIPGAKYKIVFMLTDGTITERNVAAFPNKGMTLLITPRFDVPPPKGITYAFAQLHEPPKGEVVQGKFTLTFDEPPRLLYVSENGHNSKLYLNGKRMGGIKSIKIDHPEESFVTCNVGFFPVSKEYEDNLNKRPACGGIVGDVRGECPVMFSEGFVLPKETVEKCRKLVDAVATTNISNVCKAIRKSIERDR